MLTTRTGFLGALSPGEYVVDETIVIVCECPVESETMTRRPLVVIEPFDPTGRTIITRDERAGNRPYFKSRQTDVEMPCGKCGQILLSGVHPEDYAHIVFHCPGCGSYNEVGDDLN